MSGDRSNLSARGEEFLQAVRRGMEITKELLNENERLRHRLVELEEIEQENNNLANLYVASYQLHSTLDVDEVLRIIIEIVINLIGADVFAIYLLDENRQELRAVAAEGLEPSSVPACRVGEGRLGQAFASGATQTFDAPPSSSPGAPDPELPLVCIPLRLERQAIGTIAIFGLLEQKGTFSTLDHEIFDVLAGHAATALFAARLHAQSERKLSTIQGFIDLLAR